MAHVERVRDCLKRAGRRIDDLPVVFLLNKLDLPRIEMPDVLAARLQWPITDHFVSVATAGAGVGDALTRLLELIAANGPLE